MNPENLLAMFLSNLPMVLSVLAALGLWKVGAALIRKVVAMAKDIASKSENKLDDVIVGVVGSQLEEIARLLESGQLDEAKRRVGIVRLQAKPLALVKK